VPPSERPPSSRRSRRITVAVSVAAVCVLVLVLVGRRHQFAVALSGAAPWVLFVAVALQLTALLARTEAWRGCIEAAGGTVGRRPLYRASSMGYVGGLLNAQLGAAARIAALRRAAPRESPRVAAMIAAEFPIVAVEATLAAIASFTLIGPLGLPWWLPLACVAATVGLSAALRNLAVREGRGIRRGLAVLRTAGGGSRVVAFVLVAVLSQIARNWLVLHAVGVQASPLDATALLIALVALAQLPIGPSVGAAAAILILGPHGVAAAAAAGVLLTATGTAGGLLFAGWAAADRLLPPVLRRLSALRPAARSAASAVAALTALPAAHRRIVETAYFGGLTHAQIARALRVPVASA
jgi:uncharacterized membrane protein YbhN (UPF0104 family)